MKNLLNRLQLKLQLTTSGIIWITEDDLSKKPLGFNELDYFFGYSLSDFSIVSKDHKQSFFNTKNFDQNLSLTHLEIIDNQEQFSAQLKNILGLMQNTDKNKKVILLSEKRFIGKFDQLIKNNKSVNFETFTLD